jgi:hypothetical protein
MKITLAIILIASSALADVVIPLDQWNALSQAEKQTIIQQVQNNNIVEQNRIQALQLQELQRQTEILREQQQNSGYDFDPGNFDRFNK